MMTGDPQSNLAAVSLIRAAIADDADSGMLILRQHGGDARDAGIFMMGLAAVSARALLSANGWNVTKTLAVLDKWAEHYALEGADDGARS
jgi:hypothetical protein